MSDSEESSISVQELLRSRKRLDSEPEAVDGVHNSVNKLIGKAFDPEYYSLPSVEDPQIHVVDDVTLKNFGVVDGFLDFIVNIKPLQGVPHMDYDTLLFNEDRNAIGEIFEIYGTVQDTMYALRFNTAEEAQSALRLGQEIYYAPEENVLTKTVLAQEMMKMKLSEDCDSDVDPVFSDDEAETQYRARKRAKNRSAPFTQGSADPYDSLLGERTFGRPKRFRSTSRTQRGPFRLTNSCYNNLPPNNPQSFN